MQCVVDGNCRIEPVADVKLRTDHSAAERRLRTCIQLTHTVTRSLKQLEFMAVGVHLKLICVFPEYIILISNFSPSVGVVVVDHFLFFIVVINVRKKIKKR